MKNHAKWYYLWSVTWGISCAIGAYLGDYESYGAVGFYTFFGAAMMVYFINKCEAG